jgi:hypothetical protein
MNDKDVLIKQLKHRNESLLKQNRLLVQQNQQLEAENLELKEHIARLEKNSATSSKPPSSDILHPQQTDVIKKKNRKRDGQLGHLKHSRQPFPTDAIDETIVHKLSEEEVQRRELTELPETIWVRLIRVQYFHLVRTHELWLITTLPNTAGIRRQEIIQLYRSRWDIETRIGSLKTTLKWWCCEVKSSIVRM